MSGWRNIWPSGWPSGVDWLWPGVLALIPLLAVLVVGVSWWEWRARRRGLCAFADPLRHPWLLGGWRRGGQSGGLSGGLSGSLSGSLSGALRLLAVACIGLALAGPLFGQRQETVRPQGADVVIALDVSRSMGVTDIRPSRLARSVHRIDTLLERIAGNRAALALFAGDAFLAVPLTLDHGALRLFLEAAEPGMVPAPGSSLEAAVDAARKALEAPPGTAGSSGHTAGRALVIFSDGEATLGGADAAVDAARRAGITVYAVAEGTEAGGPVPVYDEGGTFRGYRKDASGHPVTSRVQTGDLAGLAAATGGKLYREDVDGAGLARLADDLNALARGEIDAPARRVQENRYQWPLAVGVLLLLLEWLLPGWRRPRASSPEAVS